MFLFTPQRVTILHKYIAFYFLLCLQNGLNINCHRNLSKYFLWVTFLFSFESIRGKVDVLLLKSFSLLHCVYILPTFPVAFIFSFNLHFKTTLFLCKKSKVKKQMEQKKKIKMKTKRKCKKRN